VIQARLVAEVERLGDAEYGNRRLVDHAAATPLQADVTVVGAGAAGLFCALLAAEAGAAVALVSRSPLAESASYWAQGGIAAALAEGDSPARHAADTLAAGRGVARPSAVEVLCEDSPDRVRDLERLGVRFDADRHGALALGLEGGHSARRIVHAGGAATGRRITRQLSAVAAAHERVQVLEHTTATALLVDDGVCTGVAAVGETGPLRIVAGATVLATGGSAALWARTTNPGGSVGVGLALAHEAGARLADLEFMQFHPTALVSDGPRDGFLITEAVRGEGALLLDGRGERFVDELAPRDHVALAIEERLRDEGSRSVGLDLRPVDLARFPNIAEALAEVGIDPASETVPVAPAAHYTMGGVATDIEGRASVPGLLAVGETACTGLHGANRLASNSLAECFVLGRRAARAALDASAPAAGDGGEPAPLPAPPSAATRAALWEHAGLRRSPGGLEQLARDPFPLARLIARACLAREESRGAHQRLDHPETDPALDGRHVLLGPGEHVSVEEWT
jgi:L-aspartate oxidase